MNIIFLVLQIILIQTKKITTLATKAEAKVEQDKIVKFQSFDSNYFCDKSHFENDVTQDYLVFQAIYRFVKQIGNTDHILAQKSKRLSDECIIPPAMILEISQII